MDLNEDVHGEGLGELIRGESDYLKDRKFNIYARTGVQEYWLIDPDVRTIEICALHGEAYALLGTFGPDDEAQSELLEGFKVRVSEVCPS